eukprot:13256530-Alexandrium_andersonii.AAC.1
MALKFRTLEYSFADGSTCGLSCRRQWAGPRSDARTAFAEPIDHCFGRPTEGQQLRDKTAFSACSALRARVKFGGFKILSIVCLLYTSPSPRD